MITLKLSKTIFILLLVLLISGCVQETEVTNNDSSYSLDQVMEDTFPEPIIEKPPTVDLNILEQRLHELINEERKENGLQALVWESDIADVARRHSEDQAEYNQFITRRELLNPNPLIYHEGFEFGFYQDERLENSGVYDFEMSSENINANTIINERYYETYGPEYFTYMPFQTITSPFETQEQASERVIKEIETAYESAVDDIEIEWVEITYKTPEEMAIENVQEWMDSPGHRENILTPEFDRTGIGVAKVNDWFIATQVFIQTAKCGYETGSCCEEEGYYPWCYEPLKCVSKICEK